MYLLFIVETACYRKFPNFVMIVIFRYLGENPELNALFENASICYCQCEMASRKNQRTLDTSLPGLEMIDEL